jgi:hypothetical protein
MVALSPLKDSYQYRREGANAQKSVNAISFRLSLMIHTKRISSECDCDCNRQSRREEI